MPVEPQVVEELAREFLAFNLGFDPNDVTLEASFTDDLDADSLDLIEQVMELEEQFGIRISDEDAQKLNSLGAVVNYVATHPDSTVDEEAVAKFREQVAKAQAKKEGADDEGADEAAGEEPATEPTAETADPVSTTQ